MSDEVLVVTRDGPVATVRINRPDVHNALNARLLSILDTTLTGLTEAGATRAIVLTGTGRTSFCAGADLDELAGLSTERAFDVLSTGQRVLRRLECSPVPVIAAVNGLALGGGFELVLASTFAVFAEHAAAGLPEAGLGLMPGFGGTQRLPRRVGLPVAAHAMLTGERLSAARAYELGLTPVPPVAADQVVATARRYAERIAAHGTGAVNAIMLALRHGTDLPIEAGLALETALAAMVTGSADAAEAVAAFRRRRSSASGTPHAHPAGSAS